MRISCHIEKLAVTPEGCLARQEAWDEAEKGQCTGVHCWRFVVDTFDKHDERLHWICRMEQDRLAYERRHSPSAIGA